MNKYIVRDVVCDWGICSVDDLGKEELVEVCNSKANAELICEILNTDLMKDGKYTVWKDKKISELETKLAESEKKNFELVAKLNLKEYKPAFCTLADRDCEALGQVEELKQQLVESKIRSKESEIFYKREINRRDTKLRNIKQQLAKKEKLLKKYVATSCPIYQDKISFCIEQLEKVKKELEFNSNNNEWITARDDRLLNGICDFIDNQIKALKEGK